jgi:DNA-binding MarR family transcriptional regulator
MARPPGNRDGHVASARAAYLSAWRWRRAVEKELSAVGLTLTQWLVLDALQTLLSAADRSVNQNAVAAHTELDRMTVSQVMKTLVTKAWVVRTPEPFGRAYRVQLTRRGTQTARSAALCVAAATRRFQAEERAGGRER